MKLHIPVAALERTAFQEELSSLPSISEKSRPEYEFKSSNDLPASMDTLNLLLDGYRFYFLVLDDVKIEYGQLYFKEVNGKIAYTVIPPKKEEPVRDIVTEIKAPSSIYDIALLKDEILKITSKAGHTENPLQEDWVIYKFCFEKIIKASLLLEAKEYSKKAKIRELQQLVNKAMKNLCSEQDSKLTIGNAELFFLEYERRLIDCFNTARTPESDPYRINFLKGIVTSAAKVGIKQFLKVDVDKIIDSLFGISEKSKYQFMGNGSENLTSLLGLIKDVFDGNAIKTALDKRRLTAKQIYLLVEKQYIYSLGYFKDFLSKNPSASIETQQRKMVKCFSKACPEVISMLQRYPILDSPHADLPPAPIPEPRPARAVLPPEPIPESRPARADLPPEPIPESRPARADLPPAPIPEPRPERSNYLPIGVGTLLGGVVGFFAFRNLTGIATVAAIGAGAAHAVSKSSRTFGSG